MPQWPCFTGATHGTPKEDTPLDKHQLELGYATLDLFLQYRRWVGFHNRLRLLRTRLGTLPNTLLAPAFVVGFVLALRRHVPFSGSLGPRAHPLTCPTKNERTTCFVERPFWELPRPRGGLGFVLYDAQMRSCSYFKHLNTWRSDDKCFFSGSRGHRATNMVHVCER